MVFGDVMKYAVLGSGSSGNTTYLEINGKKYLIDAGLSLKQIDERLKKLNVTLDEISGVFITHEHIDHIASLASIDKQFSPKIYITEGTYQGLKLTIKKLINPLNIVYINAGDELEIDSFKVKVIPVQHDANDPVGYRFYYGDKSLVYITDTGYFPQNKYEEIMDANDYIFEANHEPDILLNSNRIWPLKKRILDDKGHLSNEDSAVCMCSVIGVNTKRIVLAHISRECNLPEIGILRYKEVFEKYGILFENYDIFFASQDENTELLEVV